MASSHDPQTFDVIIIGAGFAGLRALHEMRKLGLHAHVIEAGTDVGGTWYWNRYPGARTDSEAWTYCFYFSRELLEEYDWAERMPSWEQVLDYMAHVVDRFDMRKDITFNRAVTTAAFDDSTGQWRFTCEDGSRYEARHFIAATGPLSKPYTPPFPGLSSFKGAWYQSSLWPKHEVDLAGKRVAVVGSGATAVQIVPVIAHEAAQVTMFQRTPNYVLPGRNHPLSAPQRRAIKRDYDEVFRLMRAQPYAFPAPIAGRTFESVTDEERERILEAAWETGQFHVLFAFDDTMIDPRCNAAVSEFVRRKIRSIVKDPELAARVTPQYPIGVKRPPVSNFFYETLNRENVDVVDVSEDPIVDVTPEGLRTATEDYAFDVIIFATGFDALTGALTRIDVRGQNGESLKEHWQSGVRTGLGICVDGFPNLFMVTGPQSPFANIPPVIETQVQWIGAILSDAAKRRASVVSVSREAVEAWNDRLEMFLNATLIGSDAARVGSWFVGTNIPGKVQSALIYTGGANQYADDIDASIAEGFPGFSFSRTDAAVAAR